MLLKGQAAENVGQQVASIDRQVRVRRQRKTYRLCVYADIRCVIVANHTASENR